MTTCIKSAYSKHIREEGQIQINFLLIPISFIFFYAYFCLASNLSFEDRCLSENVKCEFDAQNNLIKMEVFNNENVVVERHLFKNKKYLGGFKLKYVFDEFTGKNYIDEFLVLSNLNTEKRFYASRAPFCIEEYESKASTKALIAEVDGIDFRHSSFKNKLFVNTLEVINGIDDDGNGLIDDIVGFTFSNNLSSNLHLVEPVVTDHALLDADHGTSTMYIASKYISKTAFIPVSGDMREEKFYSYMDNYINNFNISFVNMSISFSVGYNMHLSSKDNFQLAKKEVTNLIGNNADTLFVISSGNGDFRLPIGVGVNIDKWPHYPAIVASANTLVVGALDTDEIISDEISNYKMTKFSNYGFKAVDILAPGLNLKGAAAGGGFTFNTGTSFSAPYVLNLALKIHEQLDRLSINEIKELILKTAYIPDLDLALNFDLDNKIARDEFEKYPNLFPVRSGGIANPDEIEKVIVLLKNDNSLTVEEAIIKSLKNSNNNYTEKLKKFWQIREL